MKELTDDQIEALAQKHESFGFGRADGTNDGLGFHGFDIDELFHFARAAIAADRALNAPADRDVMHQPVTEAEKNDRLLSIIASAYQILGALDAPAHILDVLSDPIGATDAQLEAMQQGEHEPALWAVKYEGVFTGNVFQTEQEALDKMKNLNALYIDNKRETVPLYTHPSPSLAELRAKVEALTTFTADYYTFDAETFKQKVLAEIDKMGGKV